MPRKTKWWVHVAWLFAAISVPLLVYAATTTLQGAGGVYTCQNSAPAPSGTSRIWVNCTGNLPMSTPSTNNDTYLAQVSPSPSPTQCLTYSSSGVWTPAACSTGASTFAALYSATTPASNKVTEVSAGGPVAIAGGTSQGVIFSASDKAGNVLLQVNDSTTVGTAILASDVAATGSAQNIEFVAQAGSYGGGDRLTSWWNGGTELGYAENYGNNGFGFRGINANMGYRNSNADGLITASNNVYIDTQGSHSLYISSSGVGSNSGTYVGLVGIFPYGDGNQVSGISGAAWKYVDSYYYTSAGSVTCTVQTAAGSTATCAIVGTPTSWKVSVTTSGSGIATGDQVKVNFGSNFGAAPKCIVSAAVQATAAFQPFIDYASTTSSATYVGVGSTPSGTIQFTGICIQ